MYAKPNNSEKPHMEKPLFTSPPSRCQ